MSKLLRLYNSWDQYSCSDLEFKDEVRFLYDMSYNISPNSYLKIINSII